AATARRQPTVFGSTRLARGPRHAAQGTRPKARGPRHAAQGTRPKARGPRHAAQGTAGRPTTERPVAGGGPPRRAPTSPRRNVTSTRYCSIRYCRVQLGGQAPDLAWVHRDAWPHRRGERDLLQVAALRGGGLEPDDLIDRRRVVLDERPVVKGRLADDEVQA